MSQDIPNFLDLKFALKEETPKRYTSEMHIRMMKDLEIVAAHFKLDPLTILLARDSAKGSARAALMYRRIVRSLTRYVHR